MNKQTFNKLSPKGQRQIAEIEMRISKIHKELDELSHLERLNIWKKERLK